MCTPSRRDRNLKSFFFVHGLTLERGPAVFNKTRANSVACTKTARMKSNSLKYLYDSYRALCIERERIKSQSFTYLCLFMMTQSMSSHFLLHKVIDGGQLGERRHKGEDSCHQSNNYWGFTYRVWYRRSTGFRRIAWWMDRLCLFRRLDRRVGKQKFSFCMNKPATGLALSQGNWSFNQRCPGFWKVHCTFSLKCTRRMQYKKVLHPGVCWKICRKNNIHAPINPFCYNTTENVTSKLLVKFTKL